MTKEEIRTAIAQGRYDVIEKSYNYLITISIDGQNVIIDSLNKTASFRVMFDVTDEAMKELERRMLEHQIVEKKSELSALEIQLDELDKEG